MFSGGSSGFSPAISAAVASSSMRSPLKPAISISTWSPSSSRAPPTSTSCCFLKDVRRALATRHGHRAVTGRGHASWASATARRSASATTSSARSVPRDPVGHAPRQQLVCPDHEFLENSRIGARSTELLPSPLIPASIPDWRPKGSTYDSTTKMKPATPRATSKVNGAASPIRDGLVQGDESGSPSFPRCTSEFSNSTSQFAPPCRIRVMDKLAERVFGADRAFADGGEDGVNQATMADDHHIRAQ